MSAKTLPNSASARKERAGLQRTWLWLARAALFLALAAVAVQCARFGASGLMVQLAQFEVEHWTTAARAPRAAELSLAGKYFTDALDYLDGNPWALEGLGAVDLANMRASRRPREAVDFVKDARLRFRLALRERPTSPFLWANLALAKLYLNEFDGELKAALRNAEELGPWEPGVQETVVFVGLAAWQDLDQNLKLALARSLERAASRNAERMLKIVKSYGRYDLICAIEKYKVLAGPDCAKSGAAARYSK